MSCGQGTGRETAAEPETGNQRCLMVLDYGTQTARFETALIILNRYIITHPEMVLGEWSRKDTLYGGEGFNVIGNGDLGEKLNDAIGHLPRLRRLQTSVAATSEYGTPRANGTWLLELVLNMKSPTSYDTILNDGREERVINQEATMAAHEKLKLIKERFRG
jgi:N12 class adenine-specific DNA methylase